MAQLQQHASDFVEVTRRCLEENFGVSGTPAHVLEETERFSTEARFFVSIYFTGTVYGEYILALDEATAARILGLVGKDPSSQEIEEVRENVVDAFSELLNMVVGESILSLRNTYSKLTCTSPRVHFGTAVYPSIATTKGVIRTDAGAVECHFYLDTMRLDLATSYKEALSNLIQVNRALEQANRQLKEQQAQLVHAAKMASLGVLAAGVAHEINNPLAFVDSNVNTLGGYVDAIGSLVTAYEGLYKAMAGPDHVVLDYLHEVGELREKEDIEFILEDTGSLLADTQEGIQRIKGIVEGLKDFSRTESPEWEKADINRVVNNAVDLVWNQLKYKCDVTRELSELPPVTCHSGEIGQVIVNLLVNAAQAMEDHGTVVVGTETTDGEVRIRVSDDGKGIDPGHMARIFEPFFTTKTVGTGTGLGLSISYGILQRHHGRIEVESELGKGSTFTIHLPLDQDSERGA